MGHQHSSSCCASGRDNEHEGHGHSHEHGEFNLRQELTPVSIALVLWVTGLVFYDFLHDTPWAIAEYAILIPAYLISGWSVLTSAGRNLVRGQIFDENFFDDYCHFRRDRHSRTP